jgi:LacI family transcriptional regulator
MGQVNIKQLSEKLGLSISTVSKALRDSYEISKATKDRVIKMAKDLNYEPNPYASSLRKHKSKTIAVLIPEIANNFFALAINGIESIAREKNYHVLIYLTHENFDKEIEVIKYLKSGRVDGILISLSHGTNNIEHLQEAHDNGIPVVFFDRINNGIPTTKVTTNDYECGFKATEHLINNGSKDIAYLGFSEHLSIDNFRLEGYLKALEVHKIKIKKNRIVQGTTNDEINYQILKKLLNSKNRPDAIFSSIEKLAITAYKIAIELKLKIPKDLKIISFSNLRTAELLNPSLTTISQPAFEIGREAANVLIAQLDRNKTSIPNQTIIIDSILNCRDSTK